MTFTGVYYLAIVIAAIAAWLAGAGWYMAFGKTWMAALGMTPEKMQAAKNQPGAYLPFIYAFAAELVMAWTLAGLLGHQQQLRPARLAPAMDRRRPLVARALAHGRDHWRHGCKVTQ
jgi:Protein of unknown function (DUF1761)